MAAKAETAVPAAATAVAIADSIECARSAPRAAMEWQKRERETDWRALLETLRSAVQVQVVY